MNNYFVSVNEILNRCVSIQAESAEEALKIAKKLYQQEKIVLDYDDFVDVEINNLNEIVDYYDFTKEDIEED